MDHRELNRIIAVAMFVVGLIVYGITVAPTTSYWDCGEFIACSYMLGVPHPPGSPLYVLIGRIFTMIPLFEDIGLRVNIISVIVSALTVMLTYLVIVRLIRQWRGIPQTTEQKLMMYTGGVIGALAFAFSDSFWFNAVEAEVYAMSMFFTALVIWLIMVWTEKWNTAWGDKLLLLIAYMVGLAIGVHLLNLLALPTVFLIIYFKRKELNLSSFTLFAVASALGLGAIYPGIVKGIPWVLDTYSFTVLGALVVVLFLATSYAVRNHQRVLGLILMSAVLIVVGYSTYAALYIRSGLDPAIDENDPEVPSRFASYLNREQYGDIPLFERRAPVWEYQIKKMYIRYFGWQFIGKGTTLGSDNYIAETIAFRGLWGLPFLVGLVGMAYHFHRDWKGAVSVLTLFIVAGLMLVLYLNQEDPQPRERDYTYVGSFFAFALWIGIGAHYLLEYVTDLFRRDSSLRNVGIALMIILLAMAVPVNMLAFNFHEHDRSGNYVAWDYSYNILQSCEPNAIIFTNGDNDTFPIWYLQYVENIRPDVRVVNLSLLNTNWYIKQLRDEEPRVPIDLKDDAIDRLQPQLMPQQKERVRLSLRVPRSTVLAYLEKSEDTAELTPEEVPEAPQMVFEMPATLNTPYGPAIRVQDFMVDHILRANRFKKPIYFAVTVSPENMLGLNNYDPQAGLENYLRMDGLAFQIMPYGDGRDFIAPQRLENNLFNEFKYRNLNNPDVYYNPGTIGLLQNYRNAFFRLANYYQMQKQQKKAIEVLDRMNEILPEDVIPIPNYRISLTLGQMYYDAGHPEALRQRLDRIAGRDLAPPDRLTVASFYSQYFEEHALAESIAVSVLEENPELPHGYGFLVGLYGQTNQHRKGIEILERWLQRNPNDREAKRQLESLKTLVSIQDSLEEANALPGDQTDGDTSQAGGL